MEGVNVKEINKEAIRAVEEATKVYYKDELKFCGKVIRSLMGVVTPGNRLVKKEIEVLEAMCKLCIDGQDYMKYDNVVREMESCGYKGLGEQTFWNYLSPMRKKGWLIGREFNQKMQQAIKAGKFFVMIHLDRG